MKKIISSKKKNRKAFLLSAGMMFISVFGTFGASGKAEAEENENFVPGQAIVCFKSDKSKALSEKQQDSFGDKKEMEIAEVDEADAIIDISGETMEETMGESDRGIITVVESDTLSTEELIAEMEKRDDVIYIPIKTFFIIINRNLYIAKTYLIFDIIS